MVIELTFLGTSQAVPTAKRNHTAILLRYKNESILVDCGEGTQRQFRIAGINPCKLIKLLITHWHGDHCLGIPGLIESLSHLERKEEMSIYGPENSDKRIKNFFSAIELKPKFKINVDSINLDAYKTKKILSNEAGTISTMAVAHKGVKCLAYSYSEPDKRKINIEYTKKFGLTQHPLLGKLQAGQTITYEGKKITSEKGTYLVPGKKITYITDTKYDKRLVKFAKDSDVLICESTYSEQDSEKAEKRGHFTAKQAAQLAKESRSKKLILTHFSQKYSNDKVLLEEAKSIFKDSFTAHDFLKVEV